ncbi:MAG: helix-turn-helix transcriptional regulator [Ruminococcaceae bacterium]|nr:helix-turn-helix transcriptional regulator [Oscillospiraceae bacterium]
MNIGEKIKRLRTSKLMTQKELAGDEITRNMLSQIETGVSVPSLGTLLYLAERLGVPAGYLVSDSEMNETFYKKYVNYLNIVKAFKSGEWAICRDMCIKCGADSGDNEITLMLAEASMRLGISYFNIGKLKLSVKMFEEALEYSALTVFDSSAMLTRISAYSELMSLVSPTLVLDVKGGENMLCMEDICKYAREFSKNSEERLIYSEKDWENSSYFYSLTAKSLMDSGNYRAAISLFSHVCEEDSLPSPVKYLVLEDFEKCCKENEDYKEAYEISQAKMQLFEKLLADT